MQWIFYIIGLVASGLFIFIDYSYSVGIITALAALGFLTLIRNQFYTKIFNMESFKMGLMVGYSLFVLAIMFVPLGLAFLFPTVINPYFMAGTIIVERVYKFITGIFWPKKEELSV